MEKIISELESSIQNGDAQKAAECAQDLAKLGINLKICIKDDKVNDSSPSTKFSESRVSESGKRIKVVFKKSFDSDTDVSIDLELDVSTVKVGHLKEIVEEKFNLPARNQLIVINDCTTQNDDDILSTYGGLLKRKKPNQGATSHIDDDNVFSVFVFENDCLSLNIEQDEQKRKKKVKKLYFFSKLNVN